MNSETVTAEEVAGVIVHDGHRASKLEHSQIKNFLPSVYTAGGRLAYEFKTL